MGVFLFNYFADVCPQRGNGSLNVSQMGAFVHRICNLWKMGVLDSEIYFTVMLIVASCLKQDKLFHTTQTVIPAFLCCRKPAYL